MQTQEKKYVNPPEVRAVLAQVRKEQRLRKKLNKVGEAQPDQGTGNPNPSKPTHRRESY